MIYYKGKKHNVCIDPQIFVMLAIWIFTFFYYSQIKELSTEAQLFPKVLFTGIFICGLFSIGIGISIYLFINTIALAAVVPCVMALMYITGIRSIKVMLPVALGLSLFIYLFFGKWLSVNLPNFLS